MVHFYGLVHRYTYKDKMCLGKVSKKKTYREPPVDPIYQKPIESGYDDEEASSGVLTILRKMNPFFKKLL
jgi:hypothetical protein